MKSEDSSELSSHQMLDPPAELSSNASAKELRANSPLNQVGTALQAQYSRTSFDQLSEFLQVRLSEPCNRGTLKGPTRVLSFSRKW